MENLVLRQSVPPWGRLIFVILVVGVTQRRALTLKRKNEHNLFSRVGMDHKSLYIQQTNAHYQNIFVQFMHPHVADAGFPSLLTLTKRLL